ncbi:uncharacterized protein LOC143887418 [Tasmannia lanceolata]|uniref:uncharacterized protein LOC143887418 n=1 Tax=Tasmannia lanceolata TaxID=3420 RepID=UPI004062B9F9
MFHHFLRTRLLGISITQHSTTYLYFLQNPFLKSISTLSNPNTFTVSYLVNSCGLSEASALLAAKKVSIKNAEKSDSVLSLLKNYDLDKTHISKLITNFPSLLLFKPDKTLKPKLEFFQDLGLSGPNLAKILCSNPYILRTSLEKNIMPCIDFLRSYLCTNENIIFALKRSLHLLQLDFKKRMVSNVSTLQKLGIPDPRISKLIMTQSSSLVLNPDRFSENIMAIKEMGFDPLKSTFIKAVYIMSAMTKSNWEAKLEVYRSEGWSENEILYAFKMEPMCMGLSEKKIRKVMGYFVNKMGWKPSVISRNPSLLGLSFEKRIYPRCSVIKILMSEGSINKDYNPAYVLKLTEEDFMKKFVIKNQEKVPNLQRLYQNMIGAVGLDNWSKELEKLVGWNLTNH